MKQDVTWYRLCRMTYVESGYIRRIGVGRREEDREGTPLDKRGCIYVEYRGTKGEVVYPFASVDGALRVYGAILAAWKPGDGVWAYLRNRDEDPAPRWYWYAGFSPD